MVEVRVDEGDWEPATLGDDVSDDAWRQWVLDWEATPGPPHDPGPGHGQDGGPPRRPRSPRPIPTAPPATTPAGSTVG